MLPTGFRSSIYCIVFSTICYIYIIHVELIYKIQHLFASCCFLLHICTMHTFRDICGIYKTIITQMVCWLYKYIL